MEECCDATPEEEKLRPQTAEKGGKNKVTSLPGRFHVSTREGADSQAQTRGEETGRNSCQAKCETLVLQFERTP